MKRQMLARKLTYLILFLLPWQTRWIFSQQLLLGSVWEYGKVSVYGVEILMGILFLLRAKKTQWPRSFVIPVLMIGFTFLFSLLFSEQRVVSLVVIGHVLFVIGFVFCLLNKDLSVSVLLKVFFVGLIIPCLLGWFQVLTGSSPSMKWLGLAAQNSTVLGTSVVEIGTERLLRAYGSFPHPNIFGGYLAVAIFLLFWFLVTKRKERVSFWLLFCLILFSSTLVITFSRSAWLGLITAFIFSFIGNGKKRFFSFQRAWPFLTIIFLSSILSTFLFQEAFSTRLQGQARLEQKSVMERQESLSFFSP